MLAIARRAYDERMRIRAITALVVAACSFNPHQAADDAQSGPVRHIEVVAGAGRVKAGAITLDVEVGRGVAVKRLNAGGITITGAPVVKP